MLLQRSATSPGSQGRGRSHELNSISFLHLKQSNSYHPFFCQGCPDKVLIRQSESDFRSNPYCEACSALILKKQMNSGGKWERDDSSTLQTDLARPNSSSSCQRLEQHAIMTGMEQMDAQRYKQSTMPFANSKESDARDQEAIMSKIMLRISKN